MKQQNICSNLGQMRYYCQINMIKTQSKVKHWKILEFTRKKIWKIVILDNQTKCGDSADEILNVAIDAEQTFKYRGPKTGKFMFVNSMRCRTLLIVLIVLKSVYFSRDCVLQWRTSVVCLSSWEGRKEKAEWKRKKKIINS